MDAEPFKSQNKQYLTPNYKKPPTEAKERAEDYRLDLKYYAFMLMPRGC